MHFLAMITHDSSIFEMDHTNLAASKDLGHSPFQSGQIFLKPVARIMHGCQLCLNQTLTFSASSKMTIGFLRNYGTDPIKKNSDPSPWVQLILRGGPYGPL